MMEISPHPVLLASNQSRKAREQRLRINLSTLPILKQNPILNLMLHLNLNKPPLPLNLIVYQNPRDCHKPRRTLLQEPEEAGEQM